MGRNADLGRVIIDTVEYTTPEETVVRATTGSSYTVDVTTGSLFDLTLDADVSFSFSGAANTTGGNSMTLILTQDSTGGRAVTWPTSIAWDGGSAPSLSTAANATDIVTFISADEGSTWYGFLGGTAFS